MGRKKLSIEFVKFKFEQEGYIFLTTEYKSSIQKLDYACPNGHKHNISWNSWQQGRRCYYCGIIKCADKRKENIEFIRSEFKKENYKLLTKEYISCEQKLKYICPKGHKHNISWTAWKNQDQRCPYCYGNVKPDIKFIRFSFESDNYILLTDIYINRKQKLKYLCPNGHKHSITWTNWKSGWRCPFCHHAKYSGSNHPNWRGGVSFEPYSLEFNRNLKQSVKERDDNKCQNPGCWEINKELVIHHIDYNKRNCDTANLITLCRSCNSRANINRKYWKNLYIKILLKKFRRVTHEI